jgi:hypothetical protein
MTEVPTPRDCGAAGNIDDHRVLVDASLLERTNEAADFVVGVFAEARIVSPSAVRPRAFHRR